MTRTDCDPPKDYAPDWVLDFETDWDLDCCVQPMSGMLLMATAPAIMIGIGIGIGWILWGF